MSNFWGSVHFVGRYPLCGGHPRNAPVITAENGEIKVKKDWEIKKLGDVCEVIAGQSPEGKFYNHDKKGTPFYQGKKDFGLKYLDEPTVWTTVETKIALENDILMSVRAPVGDINICTSRVCIGRGLAAIRASEAINNDFLFYFLLSIKAKITGKEGAVFASINRQEIAALQIPVPPREEQKRIVKILDEKIAQLETIKTNVQTNLQNANDLFQSQLAKAFSNTTWEKKRLGDLCSKIGSGATPKGGRDSYKSEGIHLVRSMNVYDSKFVYDELACIDDKQAYELRNVELQENDVLFNITGASVCRCCVLPSEVLPARVNQHVSILRPKQEQLNPTFLCSSMLGYKEILYKMACVGGSTRQAITKSQLEDFEIPLPPLPEQKRIVKELDALSEKVRQLQEIYTKQIANCDELKQSLLQKAFEGEL